MRRPVLLLMALVLAGNPPAVGEARAKSCLTRGTTLAATERVRVYATHHGEVFHVCDLRRRRARTIGQNWPGPDGTFHDRFVAAGRVVAFQHASCSRLDACEATVEVIDGTDRRRQWPSGSVRGGVADLQVNRAGQVAYVAKAGDTISVLALTRRRAMQLASGTAIDPFSLALGDGVVYWSDAGTAMSRWL